MKNTLIIVLLAIIIGIGAYIITDKEVVAPVIQQTQVPAQTQPTQTIASSCGLTINSPLVNSTVTFPLTINATVDNTGPGCHWGVFEANAGGVEIKDQNGNTLAQTYLGTTADWMTSAATPYSATISSLSNPSYTGPLSIIFTEDNSADFPNPDMLTVSVIK